MGHARNSDGPWERGTTLSTAPCRFRSWRGALCNILPPRLLRQRTMQHRQSNVLGNTRTSRRVKSKSNDDAQTTMVRATWGRCTRMLVSTMQHQRSNLYGYPRTRRKMTKLDDDSLIRSVRAWDSQTRTWRMRYRQSQVPKRMRTRKGRRREKEWSMQHRQQPQVPKRIRARVG